MNHAETIRAYLHHLEVGDYSALMTLFSEAAVVHSPLYGEMRAGDFYRDLFEDTSESKITLLNVLQGENEQVAAGHFQYDWELADGTPTSFECVDIFAFDEGGKIRELRIIYDTAQTRKSFDQLSS